MTRVETDLITGIAVDPVTEWFDDHIDALQRPLTFDLIAGGHSNLTYRVTDGSGRAWVLRRPPLHQVLATAHDMTREHTIVGALQGSLVPVPGVVGLCADELVNDRPFYVMDFVEGTVVRDGAHADALGSRVKLQASQAMVEVLAAIHAVDIDAVGLSDLGRRDDYVARQLRRWMRQFDESKTADRPEIRAVHDHLVERIPDQGPATIVHGDYRLDNCIIDGGGSIVAVLDWEICTLGDPLVDIAQLLVYWAEPDDAHLPLESPPTTSAGFWSRDQILAGYEAASGRAVDNMDFYISFASWKLACILEGVYSRYVHGAMGDKVPEGGIDSFVERIDGLVADAVARAGQIT